MDKRFVCAIKKIRDLISRSHVPEDPQHAENTLEWVLKLNPNADKALQLAAIAHDIERADEKRKVHRQHYDDYDSFKKAHAANSARILHEIAAKCNLDQTIIREACRLVKCHETGGDARSNLLKDADTISYFEINMPLYFIREGYDETLKRCVWGYKRLSPRMRKICASIEYPNQELNHLLKEVIIKCDQVTPSF